MPWATDSLLSVSSPALPLSESYTAPVSPDPAVAADTPMTLVILDNAIVAMTGCQETMVPSARLRELIRGLVLGEEHLIELEAKKSLIQENAARLRAEIT
jgi:hypothetical protein